MRNVVYVILSAFIISCATDNKRITITGNLTGFPAEDMVYVNTVTDANRTIAIDSVPLKDGKFKLELKDTHTNDFLFLSFAKSTKGNILFIPEVGNINISADIENLRAATITAGKENEVFTSFLKQINEIANVNQSIANQNNQAKRNADYPALQAVQKRTDSLTAANKQMRLKILADNPKSVTAVMALTDLVNLKMINATDANSYYLNFPLELKESRLGRNLETAISNIVETTNKIGDKVANFNAPSLNGKRINLKDHLGKITILDFWASWCRPCRAENPNVVRIYNKYKDKGLEIVGISFDQKEDKWKQAVENDGLTWVHVSNLKGWQEPLGKPFGVRSIPTTYLLDAEGVIIAKNLRGVALENKIAELLD